MSKVLVEKIKEPELKIKRIGVELEGGWDEPPRGEEIHGDGSVHAEADIVGEISSKPMTLEELIEWMKRCYPDVTNKSCGLHVHVSLVDRLCYMQLMNRQFHRYFLDNITKWAKNAKVKPESQFWQRLAGKNSFCKKGFIPDKQAVLRHKDGVRYRHLNYCWGLYQTVECRLFPAFQSVNLSISAVKAFHNICNSYLNLQKPEKQIKVKFVDDISDDLEVVENISI